MTEAVFAAEPSRMLIAAAVGIVVLLLLIIKFNFVYWARSRDASSNADQHGRKGCR